MILELLTVTLIVLLSACWLAVFIGCCWIAGDFDLSILQRSLGVIGVVILIIIPVTLFVDYENHLAQHGSCKSEHWAGKSYVCDEYYPLPQVEVR